MSLTAFLGTAAGITAIPLLIAAAFLLPSSPLHGTGLDKTAPRHRAVTWILALTIILLCTIPMNLSPIWNGEIPGHRNQYEVAAEAFLEGRLDLDYGPMDERLLQLENPYDPAQRTESGAVFRWDHSFYNGKYYMYFGVVPVFLVFLPYRVITGTSLTTYHATQLFVGLFIAGLFLLFREMAKKYFPKLPFSLYWVLSAAFSVMSVWYATAAPALYCTAISAGLCMEVWSFFCFFKALNCGEHDNKAVLYMTAGSLFGALAFGCRPPVALANLFLIPVWFALWKERSFRPKFLLKLSLSLIPYVVVGVLLMVYNYIRFGSVTEFGQSYQLTLVDVSQGLSLSLRGLAKGVYHHLFGYRSGIRLIGYGALLSFPILCFPLAAPLSRKFRAQISHEKLGFYLCFVGALAAIVTIDILGSPLFITRYRMDHYWLFGIFAYFAIGRCYPVVKHKRSFSFLVCLLGLMVIGMSVLMFLYPNDLNFTAYYKLVT